MWLGDIAKLPETQQYYLRSENVAMVLDGPAIPNSDLTQVESKEVRIQPEISLKKRGDDEGLEIKGLVARTAWPLDALAQNVEIWCKRSCTIPGLKLADAAPIPIKKTRWLRQFASRNPAWTG